MDLSKNAIGATKRAAAAAFLRPDVRGSAAAYTRSLPSQSERSRGDSVNDQENEDEESQ